MLSNRTWIVAVGLCCAGLGMSAPAAGAETIYDSVCHDAVAVSRGSLGEPLPPDRWQATLDQRREMWREMLGLSPLPERTPLQATVTGVLDRATDGHCDCAFWINYYRWCWPDLGALIAPRALLIASGTEDVLWRPFGYRDVALRIRHQYAALNSADRFELVEDLTPHGYTPKLRQAIFTWFNTHLRGDPTPVEDDVTDFVEPEENLLVFGGQLPQDDRMRHIDTLLVKAAEPPAVNDVHTWREHQQAALARLRELTFRHIPSDVAPRARDYRPDGSERGGMRFGTHVFDTSDGLTLRVKTMQPLEAAWPVPTVFFAVQPEARSTFAGGGVSRPAIGPPYATAGVEVRNTAVTSVGPGYLWTLRRVYPLLGQTLPERQVHDLLAGIALLRREASTGPIAVYGQGYTAPLAIYAALLDPQIREVVLADPPESHQNPETPEFLGILRIGDLPENLALLYPRPITFVGKMPAAYQRTRQVYEQLGAADRIWVVDSPRRWQPTAADTCHVNPDVILPRRRFARSTVSQSATGMLF